MPPTELLSNIFFILLIPLFVSLIIVTWSLEYFPQGGQSSSTSTPAEFEVATQCPQCNYVASHRVDNSQGNLGAGSQQHAPVGWGVWLFGYELLGYEVVDM